jgi:ATP-binding cassette subfamily F protein 3
VSVGYQSQDFAETMASHATVLETAKMAGQDLSEGELRALLGGFGFSGDAVQKRVDVLSGGERIRLAFARLLAKPPNFLILDEPTTHLDIDSREALEDALSTYRGTLCVVSHDIEFVRHTATGIISMEPPGIRRWPGGYDYYREKHEAEQAARSSVPSAADAQTAARKKGADKKELRRERARSRQELHGRTRDLKRQIARTETQIERFEVERDRILGELSAAADGTDFAGLNRRLATIQSEIAAYTRRWEDLAVEMDDIESSYRDVVESASDTSGDTMQGDR